MDDLSFQFMLGCLFPNKDVRNAFSVKELIEIELSGNDNSFFISHFNKSEFSDFYRIFPNSNKILNDAIRAMDYMAELVTWFLVLNKFHKRNSVELSKNLALVAISFYKNFEGLRVRATHSDSFEKYVRKMRHAPGRCFSIKTIMQSNAGKLSGVRFENLISVSSEVEYLISHYIQNPSRHTTRPSMAFGDSSMWLKPTISMLESQSVSNPDIYLDDLLENCWQRQVSLTEIPTVKKVADFIRTRS